MDEATETTVARVEDGPWIEIIQKMELLYADLARMQTDAERRNEELLRAKAFADNIIRSLVNSLVVTDGESVITMVNDACGELLGYAKEELVGKPLGMLFAEGDANPLRRGSELWNRCRAGGSITGLETELNTKRGEGIPVSLNASVMRDRTGEMTGIVLVATDLREMRRLLLEARAAASAEREQAAERAKAYRELKSLQARLIQSEKMSSLGRMAASVAHEINNPLGAIVIFSCLLLEKTPKDFPGRNKLETIVREASRCRDIVRSLLDFARPGAGSRHKADLNSIVRAAIDLLQSQSTFKDIELTLELAAEPIEIVCDSGQMQQAFTNLLVNAAEAISGSGQITIRDWRDPSRQMVAVSFTDTGCGIAPESLEQIFEPFFTTKQEGHGTGLGLTIVYGIIERHGGTLKVDSRLRQGTTFTVWLPENGPAEASA
jgi:two-component system NtrC family sensor kinase